MATSELDLRNGAFLPFRLTSCSSWMLIGRHSTQLVSQSFHCYCALTKQRLELSTMLYDLLFTRCGVDG